MFPFSLTITKFCTNQALYSLSGFICVCKPEYLLRNECKELYQKILSEDHKLAKEKSMLLKGLQNHLMEDEARVIKLEGTNAYSLEYFAD